MNAKTLRSEAKKLISNDRMFAALDLLEENLKEGGEADDERVKISRRLHDTRGMTNMEKRETLLIENNQSARSLMDFIKSLQDSDLSKVAKTSSWNAGIHILAFAPDRATMVDVHDCLVSMKVPKDNIEVRIFGDLPDEITKYQLLIFDNRDIAACPRADMMQRLPVEAQQLIQQRIDTMNNIMNRSPYAIHFGEFLYWVSENRDFVNAANSRFTLFARIREMVDYLEATGKIQVKN